MEDNTMKRMWVNQPSTLQPLHHLHGQNVLYDEKKGDIWFLSGSLISQQIPTNPLPLSHGWIDKI